MPQLLLFWAQLNAEISSHNITPHTGVSAARLYLFKFLSHISDLEESLQELWQCLKQPPLFSSITSVTHSPFYKLELSKLLLYFLFIELKLITQNKSNQIVKWDFKWQNVISKIRVGFYHKTKRNNIIWGKSWLTVFQCFLRHCASDSHQLFALRPSPQGGCQNFFRNPSQWTNLGHCVVELDQYQYCLNFHFDRSPSNLQQVLQPVFFVLGLSHLPVAAVVLMKI